MYTHICDPISLIDSLRKANKLKISELTEVRYQTRFYVYIPSRSPLLIALYFVKKKVNLQPRKIQSFHPVSFVSSLHHQSKIPQLNQFCVDRYMLLYKYVSVFCILHWFWCSNYCRCK